MPEQSPETEEHFQGAANGFARSPAAAVLSPPVVFLVLALAVLGPLLLPGRLLALDSPLALNWDTSGYFWGTGDGPQGVFAATYNSAPIAFLLKALGAVLPLWVVEKLWLVLLFYLCGVGASRLPYLSGTGSGIGRYYAGLFYTVNPFTYVRFVSGQWGVLGAYALTPFAVTSFVRLLEEPHPRHAVRTALILTGIALLQLHGLALALLLLAVLYVARTAVVRGALGRSLPAVLLSAAIFLGLNIFWILRYALAGGGATQNMPVGELSYFAASTPLQVLSLQGFWNSNAYLEVSRLIPLWWLLFPPLLFLAVFGAITMIGTARLRWIALPIAAIGIIGIVLAAGPGVPAAQPVFGSVWEHVPLYRAFRDSHKFVALLALAYAYFGAVGLQSLWSSARRTAPRITGLVRIAGGIVLIIPLVWTLPIFGTWGQLRPTAFPVEWSQVRSMLDDDRGADYNILILPWHMYLDFAWLPNRWKRLANPAPAFFSQATISGDNLEIGPVTSNSANPQSRYVEALLERREGLQEFGRLIAPLNAKYVVLLKEADWEPYAFLQRQDDLEPVYEGQTIALYRNTHPTVRAYTVGEAVGMEGLGDYLRAAHGQDPLAHLYLLGPDTTGPPAGNATQEAKPAQPRVRRSSPISYHVEGGDGLYIIFTLPQRTVRQGWEYQGKPGLLNLGMMPAFEMGPGAGDIRFTPFYWPYLPTYVLAAGSLVLSVWLYRRR